MAQPSDLLRVWAHLLVNYLSPKQLHGLRERWLLDTLFHKTGPKVRGRTISRCGPLCSGVKTVTAWDLNIVVLAVYTARGSNFAF